MRKIQTLHYVGLLWSIRKDGRVERYANFIQPDTSLKHGAGLTHKQGLTMTSQASTQSDNIDKLRSAVNTMDCIAQKGLSEISAIAELALTALESKKAYRNPEIIAQALNAIFIRSGDIENGINCQAESVGCNYTDPRAELRYAAKRAASEEKSAAENVKEEV